MTRDCIFRLIVFSLLLCFAHQPDAPQSQSRTDPGVGILIFGDMGYHPDYPDKDDYEDRFTEEQYLASEWEDWLEDKRPPQEYRPRPFRSLSGHGGCNSRNGHVPGIGLD